MNVLKTTILFATALLVFAQTSTRAQDIDWNVFGPANYFDPGNWNPMNVPDAAVEDAFIRNGGTVVADGTVGGNPNALSLGNLDVGTVLGDGTMFIRDLDSLTFASELGVADSETNGTENVTSTGRLTIERVTTVEINGGDIDLANGSANDTSTQTANGFLTIRDVETLRMTEDFNIADGETNNGTGLGTATNIQNPTLLVENVTNILIGVDLDICQSNSVFGGEVQTGLFDVTFRNIDNLDIPRNFDLNRGTVARSGLTSYTGTVVFDNVVTKVDGRRVRIADFRLIDDGVSQLQLTFDLIDSSLALSGDTLGEEGINIARLREGGTNPDTNVSATVNMTRSRTGSANLRVGERLDDTAGALSGLLNLDEASFCRAELLSVAADGDVVFHLDGLTRVNSSTVGAADTYSAIDASDALLLGEIIAEFDFVPPAGTHVFDLIVTDDATALDDTNATFTVRDLDPAFVVDFFDVVQNGVDIVRLQISCGDSDGDGTCDAVDGCPNDPNKIAPGACGCGTADTDTDTDGTPDCSDACPNDPNKIAPGACGCGTADTDADGTPDCDDGCPNDPNKIAPGACGCGAVDTDSDGDGVADCIDACPGIDDLADANGDGIPDCGTPAPQDLCGLCADGAVTTMAPLMAGLALMRIRRRRDPGSA